MHKNIKVNLINIWSSIQSLQNKIVNVKYKELTTFPSIPTPTSTGDGHCIPIQ